MRQWKCRTCGQWVTMATMRHYHPVLQELTVPEMVAARERGQNPADILATVTHITETWTPQHETQEVPYGQENTV